MTEVWQPRSPQELQTLTTDPRLQYVRDVAFWKGEGEPATNDDYRVIINNNPVMLVVRENIFKLQFFLNILDRAGCISSLDIAPPRPLGIDK